MFIEVDVVEHNEDIPYTTILVNLSIIAQIQPINKRIRAQYEAGREKAKADQLINPDVRVSPVEELPGGGAIMVMIGGHQLYYTVTPYTELRDAIHKLQGTKATSKAT